MFIIEKQVEANISRTVRFDEELFIALKEIAAKNEISFNSLVLQCCHYALESLKGEQDDNS